MPILAREALYDRVWLEPVRSVAGAFGVSDVWLKKCCVRANIPVPERGYWTKLKAGKPVVKIALPARAPGMPGTVEIGASSKAWRYDPVAELAEADPPAPVFTEPLESVEHRTAKRLGRVVRSRDLSMPAAPIRKLIQADEKRLEKQKEASWMASWYEPLFASSFEQRRLRLLNSIAVGLAKAGGRLEVRDKPARDLCALIGEQRLAFVLDHPDAKPNQHGEYVTRKGAAGPLRLEFKPRWPGEGSIRLWNDGDGEKLEDDLTGIVLAMFVAGEAEYRSSCFSWHEYLIKRRRENEIEVAKRRAEEERLARERLLQEAKERRNLLIAQGSAWRSAQDIRGMVEDLSKAQRSVKFSEWSRWALAEADALDPVKNGTLTAPDSWHDGGRARHLKLPPTDLEQWDEEI